jgi:hypothetical protein
MNIDSMKALIPVSALTTALLSGGDGNWDGLKSDGGRGNGIVYVGYETDRVKAVYSATGRTKTKSPGLGRIIDMYV